MRGAFCWFVLAALAVGCKSFSEDSDAADGGPAGAVGPDVYPGTVVDEEHFDEPGADCLNLTGNYFTQERVEAGRSGRACLICNMASHKDLVAVGAHHKSAGGSTYTIYAYVHAAPDAAAPEITPALFVNGSETTKGSIWTPDATWHRIAHSQKLDADADLAWVINAHVETGVACMLVDDVTVTKE